MNVVLWFIVITIHGVIAQTKEQDLSSTEDNYFLQETTSVSANQWSNNLTKGSTENTVSSDTENVEFTTDDKNNIKPTGISINSKTTTYKDVITLSPNFPGSTDADYSVISSLASTNFEENQSETNNDILTPSFSASYSESITPNNINTMESTNTVLTEDSKFYNEDDDNSTETSSISEESSTPTAPSSTDNCTEIPAIDSSTFNVTVFSFNATISWEAPNNTDCIGGYVVYINLLEYDPGEPSITVDNLTACNEYEVAVAVVYLGNKSDNATTTINTSVPDDFNTFEVQNLKAEKSNDAILITWEPPDKVEKCITEYYLQWTDTDDRTLIGEANPNSSETSHEIPSIGCMNITIQITPKAGDSKDGLMKSTTFNSEPRPFSKPEIINEPIPDKTEVEVTFKSDNATANKCEIKKIIVTCEAPEDKNSNFSWVIWNVTKEQEIPESTPSFRYVIKVDGLSPFTNYTCIGVIENTGGKSEGVDFEFQTKEEVPSKPRQLQITNVTSDSFTIDWKEPENITGIMTHYNLEVYNLGPQYTSQSICNDTITNYTFTINSDESTYVFKNAGSYYNYSVTLYGVDGAGNGESERAETTTKDSIPESVLNARMENPVYSTNETYFGIVEVTFDPPCNINGPFENYKINYKGIRNGFSDHVNSINTTNTTVSISLLPDRNYSINIQVITENFVSEVVPIPDFHSLSGVPLLAQNISAPTTDDTSLAYFTLKADFFSKENGDIISYCLILLTSEEIPTYGFWNGTNETWPSLPQNSKQLTPNFWNPFEDNNDTVNFIIGNNNNCSQNYCNKPLNENTQYWLLVRALTSSAYKDSRLLYFHTEMLDELNLGLILGLTFGLLALLILIIFLIILWRRRKQLQIPEEEKRISITPEAIPVQKFLHYYAGIKENYNIIKSQFSDLGIRSKEVTGEVSSALLSENKRKNRYTNILPYDSTRVSLKIDEDDEISSDYINASYIKGYTGKVEYIATQGPLESTVRDFWRMILQENVSIIAMVSQFVEQSKEKCYQYFPNNHETTFFGENLEVKCMTELHFGTYCVRTLQIRKNTEQREVVHMQFLEWPDFGVPQGTDNMLQFCHQLREKFNKEGGLIAVHCSAGVGRTGTLIALDILLQTIDDHRDINIYKTVFDLRKQRTNMVQTEKQYMFIHSCIKDYIEAPPIQMTVSADDGERIYENMDVLRSSLKKNLIQNEVESAL